MSERPTTLPALLIELFSEAELRPFLRALPHATGLVEALPGLTATYAHQVDEAVAALQRRGLVNKALFDALRRERPGRSADVDAVEGAPVSPYSPEQGAASTRPAAPVVAAPATALRVDGKIPQVGVVLVDGKPNRTGFVAGPGGLVLTAGHESGRLRGGKLSFKLESGSTRTYAARLDTNLIESHQLDVAVLVLDDWDSPVEPIRCTPHQCQAPYLTFAWTIEQVQPWISAKGEINAEIQGRLQIATSYQIKGMSGCPLVQGGCAVAVGVGRFDKELAGLAKATPLNRLPPEVLVRLIWIESRPFRTEDPMLSVVAQPKPQLTNTNWVVARLERASSQVGWLMRSLAFRRPSVRPARRWPGTGMVVSKAEDLYAAMQHDREFLPCHPGSPDCKDLLLQLDIADSDALTEFERWFHERMEARIHELFRCVVVRPMGRNSRAVPNRFEPPPSAATLCRTQPTPKPVLRDACRGVALMVAGPQVPHKHALDLFEGLPAAILHEDPNQERVIAALFPGTQPVPPLTLLDNVTALRGKSSHRVIVLWNEPDLYSDEPLLQTA